MASLPPREGGGCGLRAGLAGGRIDFGFAVGPAVPASVRGVRDFVARAKANPKEAAFGSPTASSTSPAATVSTGPSTGTSLMRTTPEARSRMSAAALCAARRWRNAVSTAARKSRPARVSETLGVVRSKSRKPTCPSIKAPFRARIDSWIVRGAPGADTAGSGDAPPS